MRAPTPIAVVGRGCVLPGALDPAALWRLVAEGRDALRSVPEGRWRLDPRRVAAEPGADADDRTWSDRGGYVTGFDDRFDPRGLRIDRRRLAGLDPLFRWVLHAGREALREAGLDHGEGRRGAVLLGNLSFPTVGHAAFAEAAWLGRRLDDGPVVDPLDRFHSGLPARLTARALGLADVGSFALDAACASGLYAVALGAAALADRRADLVLAGAVSCTDDLFLHIGFCALRALSTSGRSRPLHRDADGLVPGEGAAMVALMRLDDAVGEGRPILGVLRGIGLSNDGRGPGFLAPSAEGQVRAMRAAYVGTGLAPRDLGWLELHATGTPVGDGTELRSVGEVFGDAEDVPVGSLKGNLGHLITAAGAAGLLKVLGALEHGQRPPSPHLDAPRPELADGPLRPVTALEPWPGVRRAGLNAFGFGGNNAHLVVEAWQGEADAHRSATAEPPSRPAIAVVGVGLAAGDRRGGDQVLAGLREGASPRTEAVELPLEGLAIPPADLGQALGQQTLTLALALDAVAEQTLPERTGVVVGMQCDSEVARWGARWRLQARDDPRADAFGPALTAAAVLGTMPNIPANLTSRQLGLTGPSFTVSDDEASGLRALEVAVGALRAGTLDAALVGAADLADGHVHREAAREVLAPTLRRPGDGGAVLLLRRLEDARALGLPVVAVLEGENDEGAADGTSGTPDVELRVGPTVRDGSLSPTYGHAHAASGLLHLAAAIVALHRGTDLAGRPSEATVATVEAVPLPGALGAGALGAGGDEEAGGDKVEVRVRRVGRAAFGTPSYARPLRLRARPEEVAVTQTMEAAPPLPPVDPGLDEGLPPGSARPPPKRAAPAGGGRASARTARRGDADRPPGPPSTRRGHAAPHAERRGDADRPSTPLAPSADPLREAGEGSPPATRRVGAVSEVHRAATVRHLAFLEQQAGLHARFLAGRSAAVATLLGAAGGSVDAPADRPARERAAPPPRAPDVGVGTRSRAGSGPTGAVTARADPRPRDHRPARREPAPERPAAPPGRGLGPTRADALPRPRRPARREPAPERPAAPPGRGLTPATPPPAPSGRAFDRAALEAHASGAISAIFGPAFAPQDERAVQCRMPEPPLLLADRVTGLVGEPGSLGLGTVWTETDVPCDAWYLRAGRMPAGLMIEAGQADLFLASWLGVDLHLGGDRAYRLLGCRLTYHRSPPRPGETLAYDIHIDGHATQGGVRLFFFHYDCHIDGEPALTVREGQAGFFTRGELDESAGILWRPEEQAIAADARVDRPPVRTRRGTFGPTALQALAAGDPAACFGEGFEGTRAHVRTPRIPGGRLQLLDRVEAFDPHGGPWGRGYLRAVQDIRPDDWFFEGHFKNDPCMPGTLMFEGCLAAMAFYLTAMGTTLDRDGWRFEPIPDETYDLVCRGQVIPTSRTLVYELFIEELHDGPVPKLYADLLCTVDGLGAFHARRMGLQLVPDVPGVEAHLAGEADREPVATFEGVPLGRRALLSSALGWPSDAFGPRYRGFDGARRAPRLPGPPYLMISRLTRVATEPFAGREGSLVVAAYDVPPEAWYLEDGAAAGAMPLSLLLEAALQPCGWLASAAGCAIDKAADLRFRNLDGEGTVLGEARPGATLRTEARLVGRSDLPSMVLTTFEVVVRDGETDLYRLRTSFGFFPEEAFASQAGLGAEGSALLEAPGDVVDLRGEPAALFGGSARLASGRLRLLDRAVLLTEGGVRGESDVDPGAWFFSAHFFEDPVQPGSLGVEAMLQLLRFAALQRGLHRGMARPRFTPVAVGRPHRWTYRGQVRPTAKRTAVTIPAVEVTAGPAAAHLEGTASFWVDGTRIYEATIGTDLVEAGADGWPRAGAVHLAEVRSFWRRTLGIGAGAIEDLTSGLLTRFVGSVRVEDPAALDGLRGRSVLYLANHQTAIETLMLSLLAGAYGDRPLITVAKREHEGSWYGRLLGWFFARPAVPDLGLTAYFDRHRPEDLPALLAGLFGRMTEDGRSLLIHAEGTRATTAGAPLGPISGVPLDEAAARGVPVVPVRFMGGLPLTGSAKLDFPYRLAPQDVWVGAPIGAEELAGATYRERQERVRAAIRALGPSEEAPNAPHLAAAHLERRAAELTRAGLERPISILRAVLEAIDDASSETQRILQHLDGDAALERDDPIDRWLASFAHSVAEVR